MKQTIIKYSLLLVCVGIAYYFIDKNAYNRGVTDTEAQSDTAKCRLKHGAISIGMLTTKELGDSSVVVLAQMIIPNIEEWRMANIKLSAGLPDTTCYLSCWVTNPNYGKDTTKLYVADFSNVLLHYKETK